MTYKPNHKQRAANAGYEPGSLMSSWDKQQRQAYEAWRKQRDNDAKVYERGLGAKDVAFKER